MLCYTNYYTTTTWTTDNNNNNNNNFSSKNRTACVTSRAKGKVHLYL